VTPSSSERLVTDTKQQIPAFVRSLDGTNWTKVRAAVEEAGTWLRTAPPGGDPLVEVVVTRLVALGAHSKWEVRRAVAVLAAQNQFSSFGPLLTNLAEDPNSRVRQAAEQALARRRDWASASPFEKQHEDRINATLDEVDARFGLRGRIAVRRASEQISNTFTRELTHELMRLLAPLTMSVERTYRLADSIEIGACDFDKLSARRDARIESVAAEIVRLSLKKR
jgi:HEAT repeat protein